MVALFLKDFQDISESIGFTYQPEKAKQLS